MRPLKDIARLVADKTNSRPALQIVVLGHESSSGVPTTGTSVRNSSGADLRVRDHAVLDPDWPDVHLADLCGRQENVFLKATIFDIGYFTAQFICDTKIGKRMLNIMSL